LQTKLGTFLPTVGETTDLIKGIIILFVAAAESCGPSNNSFTKNLTCLV